MCLLPTVTYESYTSDELKKHTKNIYERCRIKPVLDQYNHATFRGTLNHSRAEIAAFEFELKESDGGYILAEGKVPEAVATAFCDDPLSVDIWPGGRRGPVTSEVAFLFDENGRLYIPETNFESLRAITSSPHLSSFAVKSGVRFRNYSDAGQQVFNFVTKYHIKSEAALRFFVDTLFKHELVLPHYKKS